MPSRLTPLWRSLRFCGDCLLSIACWGLWIPLGLMLLVQIGIAVSNELEVPKFVLRSFEERLTASHVIPRFGRTTFDPGGRVLLEDVSLSLPEFREPVVRIRAVLVELDPWSLLAGRFEPRSLRATGVRLFVPAMLAPSGRSEEMMTDLDFAVTPHDREIHLDQLAATFAGVQVTAQGSVSIPPTDTERATPLPILESLARNYAAVCRQLIHAAEHVSMLDQPALHLDLAPATPHGAIARLQLAAAGIQSPASPDLSASALRASARVPLNGEPRATFPIHLSVRTLRLPDAATADDVEATLHGTLQLAPFSYTPATAELTTRAVSSHGFTAQPIAARLKLSAFPVLETELTTLVAGSPVFIDGKIHVREKSADLGLETRLSPALLEPVGALLGHDLRPFVNFGQPVAFEGRAELAPGGKFKQLRGRVSAREIEARHVLMDSLRGEIEFDHDRFIARHALAVLGDNHARGFFEQDLHTREFRFLLDGQLRPLAISGWFRDWWSSFFEHFEFPLAPPSASVDVSGRWRAGHETSVFVFAETDGPIIRGANLDYARTRLFIRPNFIDGLELFGTRGDGRLSGTFTRHTNLPDHRWREMTIDLVSSIDLETGAKLLGPQLGERLQPFTFEIPPHVKVSAHFDGPGSETGEHQRMRIAARSSGDFSIYRFPLRDVSFEATLRDAELTLDQVDATFAGGALTAHAKIWGPDDQRQLGFDASLRGASLGEAITTVSRYAAERRGDHNTAAQKIFPGKNNVRLDLAISAEGLLNDLLSYRGNGNAALEGPGLGEVRLLGMLSALLEFTSLRFTSVRTDFRLEKSQITFPSVLITGPNSAIQAHGDYSLERGQLDFNARVYPFQEGKTLLESVMGAVLLPLSTVLEVKLTGALDDPKWAFLIGPTNILRNLAQPVETVPPSPPLAAPSPSP